VAAAAYQSIVTGFVAVPVIGFVIVVFL